MTQPAGRRRSFRYGPWAGGRDPLEPPYDIAAAVDAIGEEVLNGSSPREALRDLLRHGRALIDWYLERTERRRREPAEVQDIPIV